MLNLPLNIYIMAISIPLSAAAAPMMVLVSGLLATHIAPQPSYATLPLAMMIIGTAAFTIPAALIMQKFGRKQGMIFGVILSIVGSLLAYMAAKNGNFILLLIASLLIGFNIAFAQQGRFAIIESAKNKDQEAKGLSLAILAGLVAAFVGTQIGHWGKDIIASPHGYAGSFLILAIIQSIAIFTLLLFKNPQISSEQHNAAGRGLISIMKQPVFIIATGCAALSYGIMALIMTATPISMHEFDHHSLHSTKVVIQSHLVAMYLPSLFTGALLTRINKINLLIIGLLIYGFVSIIAFSGSDIPHYWWALTLLGLGWNILFVTSTALLPEAYHHNERFKVQAINDFIVFAFQALASFAAGWMLFSIGWSGVIWVSVLTTLPAVLLLLIYKYKTT